MSWRPADRKGSPNQQRQSERGEINNLCVSPRRWNVYRESTIRDHRMLTQCLGITRGEKFARQRWAIHANIALARDFDSHMRHRATFYQIREKYSKIALIRSATGQVRKIIFPLVAEIIWRKTNTPAHLVYSQNVYSQNRGEIREPNKHAFILTKRIILCERTMLKIGCSLHFLKTLKLNRIIQFIVFCVKTNINNSEIRWEIQRAIAYLSI